MRLGIRRKLIGTLVLVGLLPLALSLVAILGLGARLRINTIHVSFQARANTYAHEIADRLQAELDRLYLLAQLPEVVAYAREQDLLATELSNGVSTRPTARIALIEKRWASLATSSAPLRQILHNPIADRLRLVSQGQHGAYHMLAADRYGNLIAADIKPTQYFQAIDPWWQIVMTSNCGGFISSIIPDRQRNRPAVVLAVPIRSANGQRIYGVLKETSDIGWLSRSFARGIKSIKATAQIYDGSLKTTVFWLGSSIVVAGAQRQFENSDLNGDDKWWREIIHGPITGSAAVTFGAGIQVGPRSVVVPHWHVLVSETSDQAMLPIYSIGRTIGIVGIVLIILLFLIGYGISQREIIIPILRLRQAAGAVGRGELNIRLISDEDPEVLFRADELGDLAHDFDHMTRELQRNLHQLERSDEAKKRFLELAGHELRTPVTSILLTVDLLRRKMKAGTGAGVTVDASGSIGDIAHGLEIITARASRMDKLINDILKLVQTDQFSSPLLRTSFDIRKLILEVCRDQEGFINDRRQTLELDIPSELPFMWGDRDKIGDVLINVMSNAIRFSPDGAIIRLSSHKTVDDCIEIVVEDSGAGIAAEHMEGIFEPFHTGENVRHHHSGTIEYGSRGLGLGLAIVRRFVEAHNGTVEIHSTSGGTRVRIELPLESPAGDTTGFSAVSGSDPKAS